ncbi:hypothetical protein Henu3_gp96 [Mycobacterium phage Henu3 PeY-2017]|nr:hypothetical protein Henu3_gp96 [Mycobacterium phage Henu3 PeY-2017]
MFGWHVNYSWLGRGNRSSSWSSMRSAAAMMSGLPACRASFRLKCAPWMRSVSVRGAGKALIGAAWPLRG